MPFKIIPSDIYYLVLLDAAGVYHYFNKDKYDGWGRDMIPPIEDFNEN